MIAGNGNSWHRACAHLRGHCRHKLRLSTQAQAADEMQIRSVGFHSFRANSSNAAVNLKLVIHCGIVTVHCERARSWMRYFFTRVISLISQWVHVFRLNVELSSSTQWFYCCLQRRHGLSLMMLVLFTYLQLATLTSDCNRVLWCFCLPACRSTESSHFGFSYSQLDCRAAR